MSALKDGWIEWSGGECPVAPRTKVEVELKDGETNARPARLYDWRHIGEETDIVAYRIVGAAK